MSGVRWRCLLALACTGLGTALSAQSVEQRARIAAWRDTLTRMTDSTEIRAFVGSASANVPRPDRDLARLKLGWALIRQGQVTETAQPFIDATTQFYEASVRHKNWPEAWFGLGAAKVGLDGLGVREVRSPHQTAGNGWRQSAILHFVEALKADPDYRVAAIEAAKLTLRDDNVAVRTGLPEAIEHAVALDSTDALGWMLLGRMRRRLGNDQGAADAYGISILLGGEVRGVASLELARQLAALGHPDSAEAIYYDGAVAPDSLTPVAYRKDLAAIATVEDLSAWDSLPSAARAAWLHDFWHRRELASGRPAGTRLPEHFRRWRSAYKQYRLVPAWTRQYEFGMPYRSGNDEIDDRGVIFIRHGEPDIRLPHFSGECMEPAESWIYERPEGRLIFHFKLGGVPKYCGSYRPPISGWHAVESISYIVNANVLPNLADVDPLYMSIYLGQMGGSGADRFSPRWGSELEMVRESLRRGTTTDSDPLRFERTLHPAIQAYGVGGPLGGEGRILLVWSIPATDKPSTDTVAGIDGVIYSVRTRVNVLDSAGRAVTDVDTVRKFRSRAPIAGNEALTGLVVLDVPPGTHRVQVAITDSAEAQGALRVIEGVPVPRFGGPFEISDLVLGIAGSRLFWETDGRRFPLNARNAWSPAEALEIGFELGGLPTGAPYRVKVAVADLGADSTKPPRASVEFNNQAAGGRELVTQSLGLQSLRRGVYLLTVTVTAGNRSIRRERRVMIAAGR